MAPPFLAPTFSGSNPPAPGTMGTIADIGAIGAIGDIGAIGAICAIGAIVLANGNSVVDLEMPPAGIPLGPAPDRWIGPEALRGAAFCLVGGLRWK